MTQVLSGRSSPTRDDAPTGDVSLAFTDVQGSTSLWEELPDAMRVALVLHDELFRQVLAEHGGYEVKTEGDAFMVAFASPGAALAWCRDVQLALAELEWPPAIAVRGGLLVRMGVHCGQPDCRTNPLTGRMDYFGPVVNRAARVSGAAHGGQIVLSDQARARIDTLGGVPGLAYTDLGDVRLKGLREKVRLFEAMPHRFVGERRFPPPKGEDEAAQAPLAAQSPGLEASIRVVCEGLLARAQIRRLRGRVDDAHTDLEAAHACARAGTLDGAARRARLGLALERGRTGDYSEALEALSAIESEARAADDGLVLARALLERGRRLSDMGHLDAARTAVEEALASYESRLDPDGMAGCFATLAGLRRRAGDAAGAEPLYRRALGVAEASGNYRWRGEILIGLARTCFEQGRTDIADLVRRARENARSGLPDDAGWAAFLDGSLRLAQGDVAGAREPLEASITFFAEASAFEARARATLVRAVLYWCDGETERARHETAALRDRFAATRVRLAEVAGTVQLAAFAAAERRFDDARAEVARAEELLAGLPNHALHQELRFVRALQATATEDWSAAEALAEDGTGNASVMAGALLRRVVARRSAER
jgi:class 3 adenylate cyclase